MVLLKLNSTGDVALFINSTNTSFGMIGWESEVVCNYLFNPLQPRTFSYEKFYNFANDNALSHKEYEFDVFSIFFQKMGGNICCHWDITLIKKNFYKGQKNFYFNEFPRQLLQNAKQLQ